MNILYEYRPNLARVGEPVLVPKEETREGFRTYFGFPEETVNAINKQGSTANLKQFEVFADEILIDVDDSKQFTNVQRILDGLGWGYHKYLSGGRSEHYHIPIQPSCSSSLPYSIRQFLTEVGLGRDVIDHSPIRHAGLFRTEGKAHRKTGKRKCRVDVRQGITPTVPIIQEPERELDISVDGTEHDGYMYSYLLTSKVGVGDRYTRIYALIQHGLRAGEDLKSITNDIQLWNDNLDDPHTTDMVDLYCERIARSIR